MPTNSLHLIATVFAMVLLTFIVSVRMYRSRVREMRQKRVHPQALSTSAQMARLEDTRAADNFRNLFEVPVLFYALVAIALTNHNISLWLVVGCWLFVALRVLHSVIHCTYNKVLHRFAAFTSSLFLLVVLWVAYFLSLVSAA
jgi:hypothetical protein